MNFPLLGTFLTILWFFLLIIWLSLVIWSAIDVFGDDRLSGKAKAGWLVTILVLPLLGTVIYLVARGDRRDDASSDDTSSQAKDLASLADLRAKGVLTEEEFQRAKAKVLS